MKCNDKAENYWDVVCVKDLDDCPILAIQFLAYDSYDPEDYEDEWTTLRFTSELDLFYTKTDSTSGPIMKTHVGQAPCMVPDQVPRFEEDDYLFPLERVDSNSECNIDFDDIPAIDPRYTRVTGYSTT